MLVCRIEGGRIATVNPGTGTHPARGFRRAGRHVPGLGTRLRPTRPAQYAMIPVWSAEMMGLALLQWMFLPFAI